MSDCEFSGTWAAQREAGIKRDAFARPDCKLQAGLQIKERHRAIFKLCAENAIGSQPEAIAIEP